MEQLENTWHSRLKRVNCTRLFSSNSFRPFGSPFNFHATELMVAEAERVMVSDPWTHYAHKSDRKARARLQKKIVGVFFVCRVEFERLSLGYMEFLGTVWHLYGASQGWGAFVGLWPRRGAWRGMGIRSIHIKGLIHSQSVGTNHDIVSQAEAGLKAVVLYPYPELFAHDLVSSTHHIGQPFPPVLFYRLTVPLTDQAVRFERNRGVFSVGVQVVLDQFHYQVIGPEAFEELPELGDRVESLDVMGGGQFFIYLLMPRCSDVRRRQCFDIGGPDDLEATPIPTASL